MTCAVFALACAPAWALDFVNAQAFQNLDPVLVTDNNTGATANALKEFDPALLRGSAATTSRTSVQSTAYGYTTSATTAYGALASTRSRYTLWDLTSNAPVGSAAGLGLSFNFTLTGMFDVGPVSLSSAGLTYTAEIRNSFNSVVAQRLGQVSRAYGPTGYLTTGDASLVGSFSQSFSLLQTVGQAYGTLFMSAVGDAANDSRALVGLNLDSVTLASGVAPLTGLGLRLDQTGQIITVTPAVPEPSTWAMCLTGIAALGWLGRRRQAVTAA